MKKVERTGGDAQMEPLKERVRFLDWLQEISLRKRNWGLILPQMNFTKTTHVALSCGSALRQGQTQAFNIRKWTH